MNATDTDRETRRAARRAAQEAMLAVAIVAEVKTCGCGACYDRAQFSTLAPAANGAFGLGMEWRNCPCGSTLVLPVKGA